MQEASLFRSVFGPTVWADMPAVLRKRYANRPRSRDLVLLKGVISISIAPWLRWFAPLLRLSRTLPPFSAENAPIVIRFSSEPQGEACDFDRTFQKPDGGRHTFRSRLEPAGGDELVEFTAIGLGWQAAYRLEGARIAITHRSFRIRLFGRMLRLPLEPILGRIDAEEEALDDDHFRMSMRIIHPWLGEIYAYRGEFAVARVDYLD